MMHEWKSQEKLVDEWETQDVKNPLKYDLFGYDKNEWDNVPSVIPRFSFYLQQYVKGLVEFCFNKNQEESTSTLRKYVQDLQKQIDEIMNDSLEFREEIRMKGKEQLLNHRFFAKGDVTTYQFEQEQYSLELSFDHLNEPRMLSVKQVRDLFYSLLNISQATSRIKETEINFEKLQTKCYKLSYDDEQLSNRINNNNNTALKTFDEINKENKQTKLDNERKFSDFFHRIQNNFDNIKKLKQYAEEQKMFQEMIVNKSESIISRVNKIRDNIMDELKNAKIELTNKIEDADKYFGEQLEITQASIDRNKVILKELILRTKEDLQGSLKKESEDIKSYIHTTKDEIFQDRGTVQDKFNEKLRKIKDICSTYFAKYEKELLNNQDKMNELNQRCEEWAKLIVQPQELNQARLFAIETRMKESEEFKVKEVNFIKDTIKKLIFALEQSEFQKGSTTNKHRSVHTGSLGYQDFNITPLQNESTLSPAERAQTTITAKKIYGKTELLLDDQSVAPLPNLMINNKNRGQSTVRSAATGTRLQVRDNSSVMGDRISNISTGLEIQGSLPTYDILFLKRLLFLKASIDQETTNDVYQVPLVEIPIESQQKMSKTFMISDQNQEILDDYTQSQDRKLGNSLFQDRRARPHLDSVRLSNRRQIQKSIDLQDYLNFQTGLDYTKVKMKFDKNRKIKSSQVSNREPQNTIPQKTNLLADQIKNNRFITEKDFENERLIKEEQTRRLKIQDASYPTFQDDDIDRVQL
ncbi:UNKNOWN [Stylonychia lemnae]|uniref:Uncharacterized protein n=1 Tax=Stylonychia lemnae TaxID=5949 RepID=A0A077ZS33_STYLE|nr:UNKNOWN [Stylonychia lemnae]|eukprot:CDW72692.1 UNKNOWN [Stylonychia lemnae]